VVEASEGFFISTNWFLISAVPENFAGSSVCGRPALL